MFDLHRFVMDGLIDSIGKQSDYQVIFNALGWQEKGVLNDEDLAIIQAKIDEKNTPAPIPEVIPDDIPTVIPEIVEE